MQTETSSPISTPCLTSVEQAVFCCIFQFDAEAFFCGFCDVEKFQRLEQFSKNYYTYFFAKMSKSLHKVPDFSSVKKT
jgi:hypothetical protein